MLFFVEVVRFFAFLVPFSLMSSPAVRQAVRKDIRQRNLKEHERRVEEFEDRGIGTMLDTYDEAQLELFVRHCWTGFGNSRGVSPFGHEFQSS